MLFTSIASKTFRINNQRRITERSKVCQVEARKRKSQSFINKISAQKEENSFWVKPSLFRFIHKSIIFSFGERRQKFRIQYNSSAYLHKWLNKTSNVVKLSTGNGSRKRSVTDEATEGERNDVWNFVWNSVELFMIVLLSFPSSDHKS